MPEAQEFEHDAFISYASEDRAWASKVRESLSAKGLDVFLDQEGLRVGEEWQPQLLTDLEHSRHLILLWSRYSKNSAWVDEETLRFRTLLRDDENRHRHTDRRVIQILLEGEVGRGPQYQAIMELRDAGAYDHGADTVADPLWATVVEKAEETVRIADDALPVAVLVLASTAERMDRPEVWRQPDDDDAAPMEELLEELGTSRDELLAHYGPERTDWRPFGSDRPVSAILSELKDQLNLQLQQAGRRRFSWRYLDESAFWTSGADGAAGEAARLKASPSLIVVDPLSFYDGLVASRYSNFLQPTFTDPDTFILVLAPFSLPKPAKAVRDTIRALARQVFLHYYEPPVFTVPSYSRCGANVGDEMDFKGWLMTALGPYVAHGPAPPQPEVLRAGRG